MLLKHIVVVLLVIYSCTIVSAKEKKEKKEKNERKKKKDEFAIESIARGFGEDIKWVKYEDSVKVAQETKKPIFHVIIKANDGASKFLRRELEASADFKELSEYFVMVNMIDKEPGTDKLQADGDYAPRIIVTDSNGVIQTNIYNKNGHKKHKHFFYKADQVVESLTFALRTLKIPFKLSSVAQKNNSTNLLSRGFGDNITWISYGYAPDLAKTENKPIFILIHKTWCGSCKRLKPEFAGSAKIQELSEKFVMVNLEDDEEPKDGDEFKPDGEYIPRIFFTDPSNKVNYAIYNKLGHERYRFYYGTIEQIIRSMEEAIDVYYNGKVIDPAPVFKKAEKKVKTPEDREKEIAEEEKKKAEEAEKDKELKEKRAKQKEQRAANEKSFVENTKWVKYENAAQESKAQSKPILIFYESEESGISRYLREELGGSQTFKALSEKYVLVRVLTTDENVDEQVKIDGDYYPKVFVADSSNKIKADLYNKEGKDKYKYYYYGAHQVISLMEAGLKASEFNKPEEVKKTEETIEKTEANPLARGYGDKINWVTLEKAKELSKSESKPILVIIHKTWCGACKKLKPVLAESEKFQEMSHKFIMVNLEDDEEPKEKAFAPDGTYIPRIMFTDHTGVVYKGVYHKKGNPKYKYYYGAVDPIVSSMEDALELFASGGPKPEEDSIVEETKPEDTVQKSNTVPPVTPAVPILSEAEMKKKLDEIKAKMGKKPVDAPKLPDMSNLPNLDEQKKQLDALLKRVEELKQQAAKAEEKAKLHQEVHDKVKKEKEPEKDNKEKEKKKKKKKKDKKKKEQKTEL